MNDIFIVFRHSTVQLCFETTNQVHMPGSFINWIALGTITQNKKYWSDMVTILYSSTLWGEHVPVSTLAHTSVQRRKHTNNIQALHLCCCIFSLNYFITLENIHPPTCELKHNSINGNTQIFKDLLMDALQCLIKMYICRNTVLTQVIIYYPNNNTFCVCFQNFIKHVNSIYPKSLPMILRKTCHKF